MVNKLKMHQIGLKIGHNDNKDCNFVPYLVYFPRKPRILTENARSEEELKSPSWVPTVRQKGQKEGKPKEHWFNF